ncbi:MAG: hypothetical protein ACI9WU_002735, partial [Myxococcota bacterium]
LTTVGCGLDVIDVTLSATTTVEKGTLIESLVGDLGFDGLLAFDIVQSAAFKNQGVKRSQIDSLTLRELTLTIPDAAAGQDFTFMDEVQFFAEAEGLPKVRVARGGPFEAGVTSVAMETDLPDLADYAAAETMSITTEVTGRRPDTDTTIKADVTLEVDVNLCL